MTTATNPQTGETFELLGGRWVPVTGRSDAAQPTPGASSSSSSSRAIATADDRKRYAPDAGGPIGAALIGAGDTFNSVGLNARDLWAHLTGNEAGQVKVAEDRIDAAKVRANLHESNPYAATVGGMLPTLPLAFLGGAGALGQLGMGGAISGATSQGGSILQDAVMGAGFGGLGMGGQQLASRIWNGRQAFQAAKAGITELTQGEREIVDGARRAGMVVLPGQESGSKFMRQWEASAASHPLWSGPFGEIEQANKQTLNRLAARAMGVEGADSVSAEVRAAAEHQIGQRFEAVGKAIGPVDTAPLQKTLQALSKDEATALLPRTELDNIMARFERGQGSRQVAVSGTAVDQVSGEALMRERSRIARQMRDAYARNDSSAGELYGNVLEAMDSAATKAAIRSAKGDPVAGLKLANEYTSAREQWNVLRAMDRGGASIDGNVLPGQAARLINSGDKTGFMGRANDAGLTTQKRGTGIIGQSPTGDLYDALRFAHSQIGRSVVGDSGTATRMSLQTMMQGGLGGAAILGAKRFAQSTAARAYASMSPEAAAMAGAVAQSMSNPAARSPMVDILRTTGAGAAGGAFGGGM